VLFRSVAQSARQHHAEFYWHLGDFRAMYTVDEDMQQRYNSKLPLEEYRRIAWSDFIANQIAPFQSVPVRLGIGNHELIGTTQAEYLAQFGYWLDTPELRDQRVGDNPQDLVPKPYYHWKYRHVDFISLDNSGEDGFDEPQMSWFENILERDKKDGDVLTVVVGMHRALPNSNACGHSMNGDPAGGHPNSLDSGRKAYTDLVKWKKESGKRVYVLASHSHFYMEHLYDTAYWRNPQHGEVLPGWIVGTAGAKRYNLPDLPKDVLKKTDAKTDVWGYLLENVHADGAIRFAFQKLGAESLPPAVRGRYGNKFVNFCLKENHDPAPHPLAPSCLDQ
jgi:hypothetical protein